MGLAPLGKFSNCSITDSIMHRLLERFLMPPLTALVYFYFPCSLTLEKCGEENTKWASKSGLVSTQCPVTLSSSQMENCLFGFHNLQHSWSLPQRTDPSVRTGQAGRMLSRESRRVLAWATSVQADAQATQQGCRKAKGPRKTELGMYQALNKYLWNR